MTLLFNMPSRLVITFLPRSKHLLISWLQPPFAVIFGTKKNKVCHCFHCFPIYLPWSDRTRPISSPVGKLRFMQPGCRAWIQVTQVAGDRLRLEAWGLHVSESHSEQFSFVILVFWMINFTINSSQKELTKCREEEANRPEMGSSFEIHLIYTEF